MATRNRAAESSDQWGAVPAGAGATDTKETMNPEDGDLVEQSPIERVMIALTESADPAARSRLMLYRVVPGMPGKPERVEYCTDMQPSEFEAQGLGGIREIWGPGTYEARLMGHKHGSPHFVRLAAPRFTLAPLPASAGATSGGAASPGIESALRALADNQTRLFELLIEQRNAPPVDPMKQMREALGLMTVMREAMGLNQPPAQASQKSTIGEIVDAIKELKEVSNLVNPDSQPPKSDLEKIVEMAGPVVSMIQQSMMQRQIPATHPPIATQQPLPAVTLPQQFEAPEQLEAPEHPQPQQQQQPQQPPANESEQAVLTELQTYLAQLVEMARKSESTEAGAELVYDKLPDDWIELLHMPIWWEALKSAAPQVAEHEAWMRAVRDRVVEMFAQDAAEDEKQTSYGASLGSASTPT